MLIKHCNNFVFVIFNEFLFLFFENLTNSKIWPKITTVLKNVFF